MKTRLLRWIIIDYDTNTISYDKKNGLSDPNSNSSFIKHNIIEFCQFMELEIIIVEN